MRIATLGIYDDYFEKRDRADAADRQDTVDRQYIVGDDLDYAAQTLERQLQERGHSIQPLGALNPKDSDFDCVLFNDFPLNPEIVQYLKELANQSKVKRILRIQEPPCVYQANWLQKNHSLFDRVLTWDDDLVDNAFYFKYTPLNKFPKSEELDFDSYERPKFCCMINSGHKGSNHPNELYSFRRQMVRWFEQVHPDQFDLYGHGWSSPHLFTAHSIPEQTGYSWRQVICMDHHSSYRGSIEAKRPIMQQYRFSICFENMTNIKGYVTEKILDSLFAGCVPVYWGASNIDEYVPTDCFIDIREYETFEALYEYMSKMDNTRYTRYQQAIREFLLDDSRSGRFNAVIPDEQYLRALTFA